MSAGKRSRFRLSVDSALAALSVALRWAGKLAAVLIAATLLWVLAYRFVDPPSTWLMVATSWSGTPVHHRSVAIEAVAPVLWQSVIAGEDQHFCENFGFDPQAIEAAMRHNERSHRLRGASTIAQQTAKNAFLWPGRTYLRKALEAYFTLSMETLWPKRRIMEVYLNIAQFGPGLFGAEAASERYFAVPPHDLTPYQAALLAAVLPNPKRMHADAPSAYVRARAEQLEQEASNVRSAGLAGCVAK